MKCQVLETKPRGCPSGAVFLLTFPDLLFIENKRWIVYLFVGFSCQYTSLPLEKKNPSLSDISSFSISTIERKRGKDLSTSEPVLLLKIWDSDFNSLLLASLPFLLYTVLSVLLIKLESIHLPVEKTLLLDSASRFVYLDHLSQGSY